jgi:hypothetical protein
VLIIQNEGNTLNDNRGDLHNIWHPLFKKGTHSQESQFKFPKAPELTDQTDFHLEETEFWILNDTISPEKRGERKNASAEMATSINSVTNGIDASISVTKSVSPTLNQSPLSFQGRKEPPEQRDEPRRSQRLQEKGERGNPVGRAPKGPGSEREQEGGGRGERSGGEPKKDGGERRGRGRGGGRGRGSEQKKEIGGNQRGTGNGRDEGAQREDPTAGGRGRGRGSRVHQTADSQARASSVS